MNKYKKMQYQLIAKEMVDVLNKKGYLSYYAEDKEEAKKKILSLIPEGASISVGGSETLQAMNATRVKHETPCVKTGKCMECEIQNSVCNYTGIIENGRKELGRITVIMVAEELGF